ncbi:hypothetical protein [Cellvibrio sp.]|uniref:hypothetical protein n=1 Tax=Cellvibrio sp. TaxID=1965322 RepID=UPI0039647805
MTHNISHDQMAFTATLITNTVDALKAASGNSEALTQIIVQFYSDATAADLDLEEIENILGVNESCIMDLAQLSEEDEEVVIAAFEDISNA